MNKIKMWFLNRIGIDDIWEYFNSKGIIMDLKLEKKQTVYYAKNSQLHKRTFKESE